MCNVSVNKDKVQSCFAVFKMYEQPYLLCSFAEDNSTFSSVLFLSLENHVMIKQCHPFVLSFESILLSAGVIMSQANKVIPLSTKANIQNYPAYHHL